MHENEARLEGAGRAVLSCPHCRAGNDGLTVGLYWEIAEEAWKCIQCGHRSYERKIKTAAEVLEDLKWDRILESLDETVPGQEEIEGDCIEEDTSFIFQNRHLKYY